MRTMKTAKEFSCDTAGSHFAHADTPRSLILPASIFQSSVFLIVAITAVRTGNHTIENLQVM